MLMGLFLFGAVLAIVVPACCPLDLAAAVERARLRAGLAHKELAFHQQKSAAQWSREFHAGKFRLDLLLACPRPFVLELLEELRADLGGEPPITAREVLDLVRPVMARIAPVPTSREESCA